MRGGGQNDQLAEIRQDLEDEKNLTNKKITWNLLGWKNWSFQMAVIETYTLIHFFLNFEFARL